VRSRIAIVALCCSLLAAGVAPVSRGVAAPRDPIADDATGWARFVAAGHTTPRLIGREAPSPRPGWGKLPPHLPAPTITWTRFGVAEARARTPAHASVALLSAPRSCRGPPAA
jgi:hypothetical protein